MDSPLHIVRYLVFVDGTWFTEDGAQGGRGASNIYRVYAATKEGITKEADGRYVNQKRKYYPGVGANNFGGKKLIEGMFCQGCVDLIRRVYEEACRELNSPYDEIWLYGYSRGAYVVRAVAGLFHHMKTITATTAAEFDASYLEGLRLYPYIQTADKRRGGAIHHRLTASQTRPAPKIKFLGVFDTVKAVRDESLYDISAVNSIEHFRHAVALNEKRKRFSPELIFPSEAEFKGNDRTAIQAWFLGTHADIGASNSHDGLSLYPLQWMLTESRQHGLHLEFKKINMKVIDNPLEVVLPDVKGGWKCRLHNGVVVEIHDLRSIHRSLDFCSSYTLLLNPSSPLWITKFREPFKDGTLRGYSESARTGTIIHPSVYFIYDTYPHLRAGSRDLVYRRDIDLFRILAIPETEKPFWDVGKPVTSDDSKKVRILVCGNTGVGKSTLLNRVFGLPMTEESNFRQGQHDINHAFEAPNAPGLCIHDSCGFAAADRSSVKKLKKFLQDRSGKAKPEHRLHIIWFCLQSTTNRIREEAVEVTFRMISKYAANVPVIVVGTKTDEFFKLCDEKEESAKLAKFEERTKLIKRELGSIQHSRWDRVIFVAKDDPGSISRLVSATLECFDDEQVRRRCVAVQVTNLEEKIESAISTTMHFYKHGMRWAAVPLPGVGIVTQYTVARLTSKAVFESFGFSQINSTIAENIMNNILWENRKRTGLMILGELVTIASWGVTAPFQTVAMLPVTAGVLIMCACDVILTLERAFRKGQQHVGPEEIKTAGEQYRRDSMDAVHAEAIALAGSLSRAFTTYDYVRIETGIEQIIQRHRATVVEQPDLKGVESDPMGLQEDAEVLPLYEAYSNHTAVSTLSLTDTSSTACESDRPASLTPPASERRSGFKWGTGLTLGRKKT